MNNHTDIGLQLRRHYLNVADERTPDGQLDAVLERTRKTNQRPGWTYLERWLPMSAITERMAAAPRFPLRAVAIVALLILSIVAAAVYVGSQQRRLPAPFGPAANGVITYSANGDLYVKDSLSGEARILISGEGDQFAPYYSPDGRSLAYVTSVAAGAADRFMIAPGDGSDHLEVAMIPPTGNAQAAWAPDSRSIALIYDEGGVPQLSLAGVDGSTARVIDLGGIRPLEVAWRPPDGQELVVRGFGLDGHVDLFIVRPDGSGLRGLGVPSPMLFGEKWEVSGPVWSPDGSQIAYNQVEPNPGREPNGHFRIHVVNADGTGDVALPAPADPDVQEAWPMYSPDGRSILVHRWTWTSDDGAEGWLAIMPADGSAPGRDIGPRIPGGEDTGLVKTWSPDGALVLVRAENQRKVYAIDQLTGTWDSLDWTTELPDWQRVATD